MPPGRLRQSQSLNYEASLSTGQVLACGPETSVFRLGFSVRGPASVRAWESRERGGIDVELL